MPIDNATQEHIKFVLRSLDCRNLDVAELEARQETLIGVHVEQEEIATKGDPSKPVFNVEEVDRMIDLVGRLKMKPSTEDCKWIVAKLSELANHLT